MNNKIFTDRCETLFTTFRSGNYQSVTTKQVAEILNIEVPSASQFIQKVCNFGMLTKMGQSRNTCYKLTDEFNNALERECSEDILTGVKKGVNWFIVHPKSDRARKLILPNGKRLVRLDSQKVDEESQQAIDFVVNIISTNKDLRAENELLKEEVERLKKYEDYYKQVNKIKL